MKKPPFPKEALEYFRIVGAQGGKTRAKKHSKKQLSEWGKLGGRPKGSGKKPKGGKKKTEESEMAVYKQPKSKYWWYKFVWNGEPIRESTKQTNKRVTERC